jgi:hypothetical protein
VPPTDWAARAPPSTITIAKAELKNERSCEAIGLCRGIGLSGVIDAELTAAQRKAAR